jgi:thioredoxin reductase
VYDAIIVGGGPAGLNAALVLGRAQRRTLVCDNGEPRNGQVHRTHGFLSRDGISPAELRTIAGEQLTQYPAVEARRVRVERIERQATSFRARFGDGAAAEARRVLLSTGVIDELPAIEGLAARWGISAFNCPYCDGWEVRNQPIVVFGTDEANVRLALTLTRYSPDVILCTNGAAEPAAEPAALLKQRGIDVRTEPIARLEGPAASLDRVVFADGTALHRTYAFTHAPTRQSSTIPDQLGLDRLEDGSITVDDLGQTTVPGVFAAGDLARRPSMPLPGGQIVIAAAEGVIAAVALDQLFMDEIAEGR